MDRREARALLQQVADGSLEVEGALAKLAVEPLDDLGFAKVDLHRQLRQGASEVIYGEGKTAEQIAAIALSLIDAGQAPVLATRVCPEKAESVREIVDGVEAQRPSRALGDAKGPDAGLRYYEAARILLFGELPEPSPESCVVVACAGTQRPVPWPRRRRLRPRRWAAASCGSTTWGWPASIGCSPTRPELSRARCVVAVAGMEGALASVVGGLARLPGGRRCPRAWATGPASAAWRRCSPC